MVTNEQVPGPVSSDGGLFGEDAQPLRTGSFLPEPGQLAAC
jgi:hypothetical protein